MMTRRRFSKEFEVEAVRRLGAGRSAAEVARALEMHPTELYRWRRELAEHGARAFQGVGRKRAEESRRPLRGGFLQEFSEASGNLSSEEGATSDDRAPRSSSG